MAGQNVDLGTFTFDAATVENNMERLRKEMFALRAEQKEYARNSKELDKATDDLVKTQNQLLQQGKENTKQYKENEKALKALVQVNYDNFKSQQATTENLKKVNAEYNQAAKSINSLKDAEGNLVTSTQAINVALEKEVRSIAEARESNKELLALRNQLNIADGANAEELANLNAALDRNNAFIKENVSAYEQQKIGIGDYQTAIENALGGTKLFGVGLNDVKQQLSNFAPVLNLIKGELTSIKDSFKASTTATQGFSTAQKAMAVTTSATSGALKLLKVALISTGIGAIVVVLGTLITYLTTTQKGIDAVTKVTRPLGAVFDSLVGTLQEVGEILFNTVIKHFQGLGKVISGIISFDLSKIKEGLSDIGQNAVDAANGIAEVGSKIGDNFDEAYKKGQRIDEIQKSLDKGQAEFIIRESELRKIFEEQKKLAEDVNQSFADREKAAQAAIVAQEDIRALTVERLELEKELLTIKQSLSATSDKEKADLAQKVADINKAIEEEAAKTTEAQNKVNSIRKEAANAAIAEIKRVQDEAIKANQEQLDLFLAQQGFKKKSAEEELQIARTKRDKEIEILEQELEYKRISLEAFNAKKIQINNEYLELERDLVIENAEKERDELIAELEKRKNDYEEYTQEKLDFDRANIAERLAIEQEFAEQQLEQGVINQEEYDTIIAEKKAEARDAELEAQMEFEQANKERLLIDAENERILAEQKYNDEFELKKFQLEQQRQAEIAAAEKTGADITLINEKYAKQRMEIDRLQQENKIQLASDAFGNIATILGKESALGKAVAIAQTTIDTYKSATAAYSALAGITIVGPVLGALAAGAAIAAGLANVKKITSSKPPKAERGMKVPRLGTLLKGPSHKRGGIQIEAEGGEAIINKRSTAMFSGLLSQINVAGGGIPLAARGAIAGGTASRSTSIQSRLMNDSINQNMVDIMAQATGEAVREGAAVGTKSGSESGIIGLSENREVQRNSSF